MLSLVLVYIGLACTVLLLGVYHTFEFACSDSFLLGFDLLICTFLSVPGKEKL